MTTHLGIELSPGACRIVEIDARPPWTPRRGPTRVRSFAVLPASGADTDAKLASLGGKPAAVIVWNAPSEHRQVVITGGSYEAMRDEALASLASVGLQTRGVLADIAPAGGRPKRGVRQPVVVTLASSADVSAALQPLHAAGIRVRAVTTPAGALGSLARLRRATAVPGTIEAYVALEESVTAVALVRDAILIAAHELPWGYLEPGAGALSVRPREEIARRLGDAITEFVASVGGEPHDIGQVCVAGGMPELRSMTAPLVERLDVEAEPLDSLFGIDAAHLPEPADEFRDRGAELRLAWAAAADWPPAINLLRARRRQVSRTMLSRAAVAAGIVAGLAGGWRMTQSAWWQSTTPTAAKRSAPAPSNAGATAAARARGTTPARTTPTPAATVAANTPPVAAPPASAANARPQPQTQPPAPVSKPITAQAPPPRPPSTPKPPVVPPSSQTVAAGKSAAPVVLPPVLAAPRSDAARSRSQAPGRSTAPPAARVESPPPRIEPPRARIEPPPATRSEPAARAAAPPTIATPPAIASPPRAVPPTRTEPPAIASAPAQSPPPLRSEPRANAVVNRPAAPPRAIDAPPASTRQRSTPADVPISFDAALGTILYSPDRKLAIVDGRIVGVGDEVRGARIVDITPTAVMLRDGQGRLRRLALGAPDR